MTSTLRSSLLRQSIAVICLWILPLSYAAPTSDGGPKKPFDIPAGSAAAALKQFSAQSGRQVLYSNADLAGISTNAVKGDYPVRVALEQLLIGTPLTATYDEPNGSVAIGRATAIEKNVVRRRDDDAAAPTRITSVDGEAAIELSPFVVNSNKDVGYLARNTLGGTRLDTALRDVASQVSVMTPEFLDDIAATSLEDAFRYSLNVDTLEDFSSTTAGGGGFENSIFNESQRHRTRGLEQSTLTQDLFGTNVRTDAYNTERFTLASGPNAILFGLGSASGLADTTLKRARLERRSASVSFRVDDEKSLRTMIDLNAPIWRDRLGARLVLLKDDANVFPLPSSKRDERLFGALTFRPFKSTELRLSYEKARLDAYPNRPVVVRDSVTPWLAAGKPLFDNRGLSTTSAATLTTNRIVAAGLQNVFARYSNAGYVLPTGQTASDFAGQPSQWAGTVLTRGPNDSAPAPDNVVGTLADPSVFPWNVNYGGNGTHNVIDSWTARAILEQTLFDRIFLQAAYNQEIKDQLIASPANGVALLSADANMYMPDGITPNPNVGRYYFQHTGRYRGSRQYARREDMRLSASTVFDLEKRNRWLGRHRLMGVLSREDEIRPTQALDLRVITPSAAAAAAGIRAGTFSNRDLGAMSLRAYVDDPRDPKTQGIYWVNLPFDPMRNATLPDGTTVGSIYHPSGANSTSTTGDLVTSSLMTAQSYWWKDRIVTTLGWRHDRDRALNYDYALAWNRSLVRQPDADEIVKAAQPDYASDESGGTRSLGVVVHPTKWLSLHYSKSATFSPGVQAQTPYGELVPAAHGEGTDYGFTLMPLGDRLVLRANVYETTSGPRQSAFHAAVFGAVYDIEQDVLAAGAPRHPTFQNTNSDAGFRVMSQKKATGVEVELVGNPTPQWRLTVSCAKGKAEESDIGLPWIGFVQERSAVWGQYASAPRLDNPSQTVRTRFQELVNQLNLMQSSDGTPVESAREWRVRATSRYTFRQGLLKSAFVGGGYIWSSPNVTGYGTTTIKNQCPFPGVGDSIVVSDIHQPYRGHADIEADAFAGYALKLFNGRINCLLQLNVRNVLDRDALIVRQVYSDGRPRQWMVPTPRQFILSSTFRFP